jgi:hypothetical protein
MLNVGIPVVPFGAVSSRNLITELDESSPSLV